MRSMPNALRGRIRVDIRQRLRQVAEDIEPPPPVVYLSPQILARDALAEIELLDRIVEDAKRVTNLHEQEVWRRKYGLTAPQSIGRDS